MDQHVVLQPAGGGAGERKPFRDVRAHQAACTERVAPCRLGIQSRFGRHSRLSLLRQWPGRNGFALLVLLRAGSPVFEPRRGVDGSHRSQTVRAARRWYTVVCFQVFLSNSNNLLILSKSNNLYKIIWFQVTTSIE